MEIKTEILEVQTKGHTDIIDIGKQVYDIIKKSGLKEGSALIFAMGSTAAITTIEYEPGLIKTDLPALYEKLAPYRYNYAHHHTWGDDNGAAHLRASLTGSSLTVPFSGGKLLLGAWQQIVVVDFDTSARRRKIAVQVTGS